MRVKYCLKLSSMGKREIMDNDGEYKEDAMEILTKAEDDEPVQDDSRSSTGSPPKLSPAPDVNEQSPQSQTTPPPPPELPISPKNDEKKSSKKSSNKKKSVYRERKNRLVDHNAPKRYKCAYVQFMIDRRPIYADNKNMTQRDINAAIAADWQKLSDDEKIPFEELAAKDKEKAAREWEKYEKTAEYAEFQRQKQLFSRNQRKRKASSFDDEDGGESKSLIAEKVTKSPFPGPASVCPLLRGANAESSSTSKQYQGPVFADQFVDYNKARDSYRRQLQMERANLDYELETLHDHNLEEKIEQQEKRKKILDAKIALILKTIKDKLGTVANSNGHLEEIESLTDWLTSIGLKSAAMRKSIRDAILKH